MTSRKDSTKPATKKKAPKKKGLTKDELREKNLVWFAEQFGAIHNQIVACKPISKMVDEGDGWHNLSFSGQSLYTPSAKECVKTHLKSFRKVPDRVRMAPPQPTSFDKYAATYLHSLLEKGSDKGIEFSAYIPSTKSYYLYVFGFGLGAHVETLVKETDCQCLLIFEPNIEFIVHSLEVFDWPKLHETIEARGGYLDLFVSSDVNYTFERIQSIVRSINPCSFDGSIQFTTYHTDLFLSVQDLVGGGLPPNVARSGFVF